MAQSPAKNSLRKYKPVNRVQRKRTFDPSEQLLYDFAQSAHVLGTSVGTIRRLVKEGVFTAKRLNPRSPVAKQYLSAAQVRAHAETPAE